ncbi:tetraacyldisaccharide 4'-kinase [Longimicrobium sp.]|uniref:tetraacyldisaccharide 4'-kinase n=1 Tax=Longimicrobium sp. TaxID=2029185 RepID=UPI002E2ED6FB|nr:tetraacyldisaccharide 4'-kinase [Longimicrobium sp.]HEX6038454.1 tetraacyldisaccharide 4'-kinase [Longimicrobium sp.]
MQRPDDFARRVWAGEGGALGAALRVALAPAEAAFRGIVAARNGAYDRGWMRSEQVGLPVISVGNVAVGGAGKTPFAAWLARRLADWGRKPAIALRGYGEDEIVLHRELNPDIPVFRGKRRADAAREALAAGRDTVVLDDAFQHRALARDLDLVLIPVEGWEPRPHVLPRGPWREGLDALARAHVIVLTRKSADAARAETVAAEVARLQPGTPVIRVALLPSGLVPLRGGAGTTVDALAGRRVLAVAALATPEPFFATLRQAGAEVDAAAYPDHHPFSADDARALVARAAGRMLVMTHKDAVKLRALLPADADAWVLEQRVVIESGADALDVALRRALTEHEG